MHAMFMAKGPVFKDQYTIPSFESIDLYNLFATVLGIQNINPGNNGTLTHILPMLKVATKKASFGHQLAGK